MSRRVLPLLLIVLASCHGRFRRELPSLDAVRPVVVQAGGPEVDLGEFEEDSLGAFVLNAIQAARAAEAERYIRKRVEQRLVHDAFVWGLTDALAEGGPVPPTEAEGAPRLAIRVDSFGLSAPEPGWAASFHYDVRVRIERPDGRRIYRTGLTCTTGAGMPDAVQRQYGHVYSVRRLYDMDPDAIQEAFENVAYWCGQRMVARMRRHAGG